MKRFLDTLSICFFILLFVWPIDKRTGIRTQTGANIPRSDLTLTRCFIKTGTLFYISTFWTYLPPFVLVVVVCFGYRAAVGSELDSIAPKRFIVPILDIRFRFMLH